MPDQEAGIFLCISELNHLYQSFMDAGYSSSKAGDVQIEWGPIVALNAA